MCARLPHCTRVSDNSESGGQDGSGSGIYGQRYDASGAAAGSEFSVNTFTSSTQSASSVAALADGGFIVTWSSDGQDGSGWGVYGQRYSASGAAAGSEFRVNTFTSGTQANASVAALDDGGFVVTWLSFNQDGNGFGIYGQRYGVSGAAVGAEFRVNTFTGNNQELPSVIALDDGGFVVTWMSLLQDGSGNGIYGQRYDASGAAVGTEFRANTTTGSDQVYPSAIALDDGGFVVTWSSLAQDGSGFGMYGQRYDASGAAVGAEFQINQVTPGHQVAESFSGAARVALLADGGLVQTWTGLGTEEVFVRLIDVPNNPPVITSPPATGAVQEDTTVAATGTILATDPDAGTILRWSIDGGTAPGGADYHVTVDNFRIARDGVEILNDEFDDGVPPPDPPTGTAVPGYGTTGGLSEGGGRLVFDAAAGATGPAPGAGDPFITSGAVARTNVDPGSPAGLKTSQDFAVEARFDLTLPSDPREAYGIRLTDRLQGGPGTPPDRPGDDIIELVVRRGADGGLRVQLRELDFVADQVVNIGAVALAPPPGADQIVLRLTHSTADVGAAHASFDYLAGGVVVGSSSIAQVGRIFGTETPGNTSDDDPARCQQGRNAGVSRRIRRDDRGRRARRARARRRRLAQLQGAARAGQHHAGAAAALLARAQSGRARLAASEGALPVAAAAQRLQGHRHRRVEGLAAPAPGHWTPDLAHVIPVDHEDQTAGQILSSPV